MAPVLDPEGAHLGSLRRLADFKTASVIEVGCGDGRLTTGLAEEAASVRKHYGSGAELVNDFEDSRRDLPAEWIPRLLAMDGPCAVRERCRTRRLRSAG